MATEIAELPLKAGISLDRRTDSGRIWEEVLSTVLGQDGAQRCYFGHQVENPSMLRLFVDWDSIDAHKKFTKDPAYGPFVKSLLTLLDGGPKLFHVELKPHPSPGLANSTAPVTEVFTAKFPSSISSSQKDEYAKNAEKFLEFLKTKQGFTGASSGWSDEIVDDAKLFVGVIGWTSVDAHMDLRNSQEFKDNVHLIRSEDIKGVEMYHVPLTEIQAGFGAEERGDAPAQDVQDEVLNPQAGPKNPPKTSSQ